MPRDLEPQERSLFEAFAVLRQRVTHVGITFETQLRERLDDADRPQVGLGGALGAAVTQLLNLLTFFAHEPARGSDDEDSHAP
jgi:hypothetical protein